MNKVLLTFLLGLFTLPLVYSQGMKFHEGNWAEALEKAGHQDKLVFLDAYTTWCGPCKLLAKKTFPDKEVGNFYNQHFINVTMDMEKGEGLVLAKKYDVKVYPTLLFLDEKGKIVHRSAGYHTVKQFLELGEKAISPEQRLATLNAEYAKGNRDPEFLYDYAFARFEVQDGSHAKIAEDYLATQDDWSTDDNRELIFMMLHDVDSEMFDYFVSHKAEFVETFGEEPVQTRLNNLVQNALYEGDSLIAPEKARALYDKLDKGDAEKQTLRYTMTYARQRGDRKGYAEAAVEYLDKFPSDDPDELNEIAWTFYRVIEDKKLLKKAVKWSKKSIDLSPSAYNYDTLAALYYKLKKKGKARRAARKSISLAKFNGFDASETEELLMKINEL